MAMERLLVESVTTCAMLLTFLVVTVGRATAMPERATEESTTFDGAWRWWKFAQ
jgi:hypothetical protein